MLMNGFGLRKMVEKCKMHELETEMSRAAPSNQKNHAVFGERAH